MATVHEILDEFHRHRPRFYAIRTNNGWVVMDSKHIGRDGDSVSVRAIARDTDGEKIARLVKLLNAASDV